MTSWRDVSRPSAIAFCRSGMPTSTTVNGVPIASDRAQPVDTSTARTKRGTAALVIASSRPGIVSCPHPDRREEWPMTLPARMKFGIFLAPFHHLGENPTLGFERDLELIRWLDHLGYDEAWIGEHHSSGW